MTATVDPRRADADGLRALLGCATVRIEAAPEAGYSAETVVFEADGSRLVLRAAPRSRGMFAVHDLDMQVRCLHHIRAHGLPVPTVVATDLDGRHLGRPAYVMDHVAGRVPPDGRPPFTAAGFLHDADPTAQRTYSTGLVDLVADLHGIPALDGLPIGPGPGDHLAWCTGLLDQVADVPAPPGDGVVTRAAEVLATTLPGPDPAPVLLWGDARPANTMVGDDFRITAMLDWELAGTGAPEFDVAWMNEMNRLRAMGEVDPVLPGFLTEAQVWDRWSARTGRPVRDLAWHRLFAAYKVAVLMDLHLAERVRYGALAPDAPVRTGNRSHRRLAELLPNP
ncbi:phosphotransferase family protein [Pseudonocardia halophobica]|uniref:Aminoglycoside phosphotransferase n=1 Tax=Pseudonocardia halophobica TaxID=29401 RepID=A0A9W6P114_9PSEU|nr:phosphotransferase family protein [Pseudonocardia halophobica]GLL15851.1 aminoglycoside phosphotransferase [Pseudonocardia halophobica]